MFLKNTDIILQNNLKWGDKETTANLDTNFQFKTNVYRSSVSDEYLFVYVCRKQPQGKNSECNI